MCHRYIFPYLLGIEGTQLSIYSYSVFHPSALVNTIVSKLMRTERHICRKSQLHTPAKQFVDIRRTEQRLFSAAMPRWIMPKLLLVGSLARPCPVAPRESRVRIARRPFVCSAAALDTAADRPGQSIGWRNS